jgi:hypothetical protein
MKLNAKILLAGTAAVAGLALVGVGAGASFTDSADAHQHIDTGTLTLNISAPDGTVSNGGHTVSWSITNSGSQIDQSHSVTLTNVGSLPMLLTTAVFSDPGSGTALANDLQANFDGNTGSLAAVEAPTYTCQGPACSLAPGGSLTIPLDYTSPAGGLNNVDEGQSVDPDLTFSAVESDPAHHDAGVHADGNATHYVPANG